MKFYRVDYYDTATTGQLGYSWHTRRREAEQRAASFVRENADSPDDWSTTAEVEVVEIEPTKAGILRALKVYASHPNNG